MVCVLAFSIPSGTEAPSERPLSRDMNRELRKKFVNPVADAEIGYHAKAPSNVAYAIASRPVSEVSNPRP